MTIIITETIKYSKLDPGGHRMIKLTCKNSEFVKLFGTSIKLCGANNLFDFITYIYVINHRLCKSMLYSRFASTWRFFSKTEKIFILQN